MLNSKVFDNMIEEKLLNLHTAFIGVVIGIDEPDVCSVQPLDKIKAYGHKPRSQSVITRVPILHHVRKYTLVKQKLKVNDEDSDPNPHPKEKNIGHLKVEPLEPGDLVLCVCAERDISSSSKGVSTTPPVGHHQIANAIVVGYFGKWPHEEDVEVIV